MNQPMPRRALVALLGALLLAPISASAAGPSSRDLDRVIATIPADDKADLLESETALANVREANRGHRDQLASLRRGIGEANTTLRAARKTLSEDKKALRDAERNSNADGIAQYTEAVLYAEQDVTFWNAELRYRRQALKLAQRRVSWSNLDIKRLELEVAQRRLEVYRDHTGSTDGALMDEIAKASERLQRAEAKVAQAWTKVQREETRANDLDAVVRGLRPDFVREEV